MNKAKIIAELENMVVARLFSGKPWLADRETRSAYYRKLIQMGLMEESGGFTPLGKELDVELFSVFMGLWYQYDVPMILEEHGFIDESEFDAYVECTSDDGDRLLIGYVKRAYFDYRKATKFLH
jgi:hypothetical protein